jgi:hypothetical protein
MTVIELLTRSYRAANVISFAESPSAEQGTVGINELNGLIYQMAEDNLIQSALIVSTQGEELSLPESVQANMHHVLAVRLANASGVSVSPELAANADFADQFIKRQAMNPRPVTSSHLPIGTGNASAASIINL